MVLTGSRDIRNTNSVKSAQANRDSSRKVILVTKKTGVGVVRYQRDS